MVAPNNQSQCIAKKLNRLMISVRFVRIATVLALIFAWIKFEFPTHIINSLWRQSDDHYLPVLISAVMFSLWFFSLQLIEELVIQKEKIRYGLISIPFTQMMMLSILKNLVLIFLASGAIALFFYFVDFETREIIGYITHDDPQILFTDNPVITIILILLLVFLILSMDQPIPEIVNDKILKVTIRKMSEGRLLEEITRIAKSVRLKAPLVVIRSTGIVRENYNAGWQTKFLSQKMIVGDGLIQSLSNEELMGVASHEIGHGLHKHNSKIRLVSYINNVIGMLLLLFVFSFWQLGSFSLDPVSIGVPALVGFYIAYRFLSAVIWLVPLAKKQEIIADRCAIALGSSPEVYAKVLVAMTDIGILEYKSSWIDWFFLSDHPSTERRVKVILAEKYHDYLMQG